MTGLCDGRRSHNGLMIMLLRLALPYDTRNKSRSREDIIRVSFIEGLECHRLQCNSNAM